MSAGDGRWTLPIKKFGISGVCGELITEGRGGYVLTYYYNWEQGIKVDLI